VCPLNVGGKLAWTLTNDTTGAVVKTGDCGDAQTDPLPAGTYRLDVTPGANTAGTYQLSMFTVPAPQSFEVQLPLTISDGSPAAGAGNLETKASKDIYRFPVAEGDQVYVNPQVCPLNVGGKLAWTLTNDTTGTIVKTGGCSDGQTDPLPAGTYRLDVTPGANTAGAYTLNLFAVPAPQSFDVQLPAAISNGAPAAGAGNLETKASKDTYRFMVADGNSVYINPQDCPWSSGYRLTWTLTNDTTGTVVKTGGCSDAQTDPLPAGTYRLDITPENNTPGTYNLNVFTVPAPQTFEVQLPVSINNGAPAAGAGNLETPASKDSYRFMVADGNSVYVKVQDCRGTTATDSPGR
jgi:uncharacterized protein YdeI (BOF family)